MLRPLVGAIFMALAAPAAMAAVTPPAANVLPGQFYTNNLGTTYTSASANSATITLGASGANVLQFGGSSTPVATSVAAPSGITTAAGFNIGSSATLDVNEPALSAASVLINDITGNPSQIYGTLNVTGVSTAVYVANANGVIVGNGASINLQSGGGIIGEAQNPATFITSTAVYSGNGTGAVTLQGTVTNAAGYFLVAGNGTVNVDTAIATAAASMSVVAGSPFSAAASASAATMAGSSVSTAALNIGSAFIGSIANVLDAGSFSNAGTVTVASSATIGTSLTNSGTATFNGVNVGTSFTNNGTFNDGSSANIIAGTTFVNNGSMSAGSDVTAASIVNNGTMTNPATGLGFNLTATGTAGIVNAGTMNVSNGPVTLAATSTSAGSVGISNTGTISNVGLIGLSATAAAGNFVNTGTIGYSSAGGPLSVSASNGSITLGGTVNTSSGALSSTNALGDVTLAATSGNVVLGTMLYGSTGTISGNSVTVTSGGFVGMPGTSTVDVNAASGGALGLYPGTVLAAPILDVSAGSNNVVLAGTLGNASTANLSVTAGSILGGVHANGGFSVSSGKNLNLTVSGNVVDDNQPNTTEINYLKAIPVNANGGSVFINLNPTNAGTAKQYVNLGVEGSAVLTSSPSAAQVTVPGAIGLNSGTYPWGGLTVQASGSITTGNTAPVLGFYYPGQMFFATDNYSPTMTSFSLNNSSTGTITVNNELSNAVPYALPGMGGMAFLSDSAPKLSGGYVLTNANAWINFPSSGLLAADNQGAQNLKTLGTTTTPGYYYGLVNSNGSLTSTLMQSNNTASYPSNKFNSVTLP
ncbi:hypothetical protein JKG47_05815 [Acidithiobacillus sp. MC6.1]|nr:hypothetical protein [Acidithiobacillus sp. MC6.1]